jgi:hypothetical protein
VKAGISAFRTFAFQPSTSDRALTGNRQLMTGN